MNYHKNHGNLKRCWGLIFCSLSILLGACTTKVVKQQDNLPIEDSTEIEVNTTVLTLPDTLYPSAERVRYDVEIKIPATSPCPLWRVSMMGKMY